MTPDELNALSIREMKDLISKAGLDFSDCSEKSELRSRAADALAALAAAPPPADGATASPAAAAAPVAERTLGGYACRLAGAPEVLSGSTAADLAVIVLHGFGATNGDFADIPSMLSGLGGKKVIYAFPQAPATPIGNAWWQIDLMGFMALQSADDASLAKLIREEPAGLKECRVALTSLIGEVRKIGGGGGLLESRKVVLGGFSQGAITALDVCLHQPEGESLGGCVFMSGAPQVVEQWSERLAAHPHFPVLITHGMADPMLPCKASTWVKDLLEQKGASVTYKQHAGGHELGGPQARKSSP